MKISTNGIALIKREEGDKLRAYPDSRGIPTIGVGHTGRVDGKPVALGMVITPEQSSALLRDDLAWVENAINNRVSVPLTQNQYDALCSFVFNIGETKFYSSTFLRLLNRADYQGAANEMLKWKRSGDDPDILLPRRQRERRLFLS